ncbi:105aa long hypothetical protein [Pyrococcus horikoshii OT3]|uniref:Uncharacterized protein n=1 Tax=Pyrococcus horikoshii (strain ATCC 700860 / DSM 12428 / JCM 9974 / NBRC 100139 / OT-3) TaxID=70601 RepID=O59129_PYRHO|nr:105aa long hypothetical protein [Pyrococcus horikoshii OT3]
MAVSILPLTSTPWFSRYKTSSSLAFTMSASFIDSSSTFIISSSCPLHKSSLKFTSKAMREDPFIFLMTFITVSLLGFLARITDPKFTILASSTISQLISFRVMLK